MMFEKYMFVHRREDVDLGELEIEAFSRVYNRDVCSWFNGALGFMMVHRSLSDNVAFPGRILDFDTCVHLYYYADPGHYTLLALRDPGATGFWAALVRVNALFSIFLRVPLFFVAQ
jgi:hypothetical protein